MQSAVLRLQIIRPNFQNFQIFQIFATVPTGFPGRSGDIPTIDLLNVAVTLPVTSTASSLHFSTFLSADVDLMQ